jgi:NDP-sugar pyrophosphorylase family protein
MKGIILAAGLGTRLYPLTKVTSKELLPIYNKPMIYYPLNTLVKSGIKDILIIVAPGRMDNYLKILGNGEELGINITYKIQEKPKGLADAFIIGEDFIGENNVTMILGDNIFEQDFADDIKKFKSGAKIFAKKVSDPERFGVVKFNEEMKAETIIEKPKLIYFPFPELFNFFKVELIPRSIIAVSNVEKISSRFSAIILKLHLHGNSISLLFMDCFFHSFYGVIYLLCINALVYFMKLTSC